MRTILLFSLITGFFTNGCSFKDDESVDQQFTDRISQEAEQNQVKEKEAREQLSTEMEEDLEKRQRLYQSLKGVYFAESTLDEELYRISLEIVSTVLPYKKKNRIRTPEEVSSDLERLGFELKLTITDVKSSARILQCTEKSLRMDLERGTASWISTNEYCNNVIHFSILPKSINQSDKSTQQLATISETLVNSILEGRQDQIEQILLTLQPNSSNQIFKFSLKRE